MTLCSHQASHFTKKIYILPMIGHTLIWDTVSDKAVALFTHDKIIYFCNTCPKSPDHFPLQIPLMFQTWPMCPCSPWTGWWTWGTGQPLGARWVWREERRTPSLWSALGHQDLHPFLDLCSFKHIYNHLVEIYVSVTNCTPNAGTQLWWLVLSESQS